MNGTKSFGSLTPTLLARKGGAKPAMRPQLQPLIEFHEAATRDMDEDLGWNDMGSETSGDEQPHREGGEVVSISGDLQAAPQALPLPEVVTRQANLSSRVATLGQPRASAPLPSRRVAFTLRLDTDRHLKLRLASTMLKRSAQDIVTEALDKHLAELAGIEAIAAKMRKSR